MTSEPEYLPNDQRKHLGEQPWKDSPGLDAWEKAHNHDVRSKCIPEYGCLAVEAERNWLNSLLWRVARADCVYVTFSEGKTQEPRMFVDVDDGLWDEIAKAVGYDEMGG